jgi:hypothetical protein
MQHHSELCLLHVHTLHSKEDFALILFSALNALVLFLSPPLIEVCDLGKQIMQM